MTNKERAMLIRAMLDDAEDRRVVTKEVAWELERWVSASEKLWGEVEVFIDPNPGDRPDTGDREFWMGWFSTGDYHPGNYGDEDRFYVSWPNIEHLIGLRDQRMLGGR